MDNDGNILQGRIWRPFLINLSLVVVLFALGLLAGLLMRNQDALDAEVLTRARSHFSSIVLTRRWNASHGGVYVEKRPGVVSNPYLKNPDVTTVDGRVFTLKNPALMTREISELAAPGELLTFHITSLKPLNPANAPDSFELDALKSFEKGAKEVSQRIEEGDAHLFRYMAPLYVEKPCLECHAAQGYKLGDVRGGISVTFGMDELESHSRKIIRGLMLSVFAATLGVLGLIYFFIRRLMNALRTANRKIAEMATIDELTGIFNRRQILGDLSTEFGRAARHKRDLSILMVDIDHFKAVNDTHGHQAGDKVLTAVAGLLRSSMRATDLLGRYGGEEFCAVLPETDVVGAVELGEKLLSRVREAITDIGDDKSLKVTISIGAAQFLLDRDSSPDVLIARADKALYKAKLGGRDRIVSDEPLNI